MKLKAPTTYQEQLKILKSRGVVVDDDEQCLDLLKQVRYYRLSAYLLPFKNSDSTYRSVNILQIIHIYQFDQLLRMIIFQAIEDIEIYMRSAISYQFSHQYGPEGYTSPANFNEKHDHAEFQSRISSCVNENKKTLIAQHHIDKYQGRFPIWVIIEFFSMGMMSYFYRGMKTPDKKAIAKEFHTSYRNLESWFRCLTDLRNKCAHYSRLYYWVFTAMPRLNGEPITADRRLFTQLYMLKLMFPVRERWNDNFLHQLEEIINTSKDSISLKHIGFPDNWKSILTKE